MPLPSADVAAAIFVANLPSLCLGDHGALRLGGKPIGDDSQKFQVLYMATPEPARSKLPQIGDCFGNATFGKRLTQAIAKQLDEASSEMGVDPNIIFSADLPIPIRELKFVYNLKAYRKSFLYQESKDLVFPFDFEAVKERLEVLVGKKNTPSWISDNSINCYVRYVPNQPRLFTLPDSEASIFNTWSPAAWAIGWEPPKVKCPCPLELDIFLSHLFPDAPSNRAMRAWLRDATFSRAFPILVLTGTPGTGKNTLIEVVTAALVGIPNYKLGATSWGKTRFPAAILTCRLFFKDEINLDQDTRDLLKAVHNTHFTAEEKHMPVGGQEEVHASVAVANNFPSQIKLEYSDRKFFAPEITQIPLDEVQSIQEIEAFVALFTDVAYLRRIADYLYSNFEVGESRAFPKTELFKRLCINSYAGAQRAFIDHCRKSPIIESDTINRNRHTMDCAQAQDLILHYETNFKEGLATLEPGAAGFDWRAISKIVPAVKS